MASMASPVDSVDLQLRQIGDALRDYLNNGTTATRKVKPPSSGAARDLLQRLLSRLDHVSSELSDSRKLAIPNAAFANRPDTPESPDGSSAVQQDAVSLEDDDVLATTEHPPSTATAASPRLSVASQVSSALPSVSGRNSKRALARGMPFFPIQYQDMNVLNEDLYEEYSRHPATRERGYFKLEVAGLPPLAVEKVEAPTRDHAISFRYKRDALGTVKVDTGKRLRFNPPSLPLPGSAKLEWSFEEQQKLWNESARNPPVGTMPYIIGNPLFPDVELSPGEKLRRRGRTNLEGINTQYIYWNLAGTTITTMHREDAHVRSENLLRSGEIKMWCFVKPKDSRALEKHMREEFRGMRHCSQSVRHLSRHIPPELLDKWGVEYTLDYCLPGQAMVTEPGTYHQVLNLGPNYALAINLEYNSSPDDPPRYRFCDRYCPDQTSVSAEDFQLYRGPNGTPLREVSVYEPDTPKEDARQRSKRRQRNKKSAEAESDDELNVENGEREDGEGRPQQNAEPNTERSIDAADDQVRPDMATETANAVEHSAAPEMSIADKPQKAEVRRSSRMRRSLKPAPVKVGVRRVTRTRSSIPTVTAEPAVAVPEQQPLPVALPSPDTEIAVETAPLQSLPHAPGRTTKRKHTPLDSLAEVVTSPAKKARQSDSSLQQQGGEAQRSIDTRVEAVPAKTTNFPQPDATPPQPPQPPQPSEINEPRSAAEPRPPTEALANRQHAGQHMPQAETLQPELVIKRASLQPNLVAPVLAPQLARQPETQRPLSAAAATAVETEADAEAAGFPQQRPQLQVVQAFAGAESAPPGKTTTPVTDATSPVGEISSTVAKAPTLAAAKTASPTAKTTKTTPRPRRSSKSTKAPAVVCKTITPVPLPPQYLHLRQLQQQQQQKDALPKRVPSPAPVMSAQTGNSATPSPSQQSPVLAPSVAQSSNELPLPTPQLPEGRPDQSNDLPERAPNAVRVARAADPTKTASAKPRRRVADAPADKSRKKRRLEPRVSLQPTSPAVPPVPPSSSAEQPSVPAVQPATAAATQPPPPPVEERSDKNALEHLATLVRAAEPGSCPLEDVDISGRTAFKRLDALVRGWRRHSSLFPPSTLTNTALFSHIESLKGDEALHVFLRRFAKMQMAAFSEKCHGDMEGPFADLNWDRCKLHDYIREGKCWRALCGDTDGLLCLMPPDLEYQDVLYGEKVTRLREQLKNQLAVRLCRIGEHLMLKIWCGARAPEYLWEDVEDASELSDKDLYDLILPYVPRTENYFDPDPRKYDWTVRPRGWRWAWPADPTLVLDPTARRCSMCYEDTCLCHANKVPKLPRICWDGSKGTGVRAVGAYRENDILGEAVGQLVPFGVHDEEWCLPIHRPDVGNRGTPLAEIYSAKEGNWVRKVRHNPEDPSAAFKMMKISGRWRNMLIAARDIEDGQEITAMYGKGYKRGDKPANCYSYIEGINTYIEILDAGDSDEDDG